MEVTAFIGRREQRGDIRALLAESRELTLVGPGGIGKTRLALRVAADARRAFSDGVCCVSLDAVTDLEAVPDEIAAAIGVHGAGGESTTALVVSYLAERRMLLLLDNCEHLIDAVANVADLILRHCPHVRILATSREPLRIAGESVQVVGPLSTPSAEGEALQQSEAVLLFLDRARSSAPWFELSSENEAAVAGVCRKLEGIPLAIELAAARLTSLSVFELDQGLSDHWELLNRGRRTAPSRQKTMAACVDWSFDLCTPAERKAWALAAVFVDGFDLDAAREICVDAGDPPIEESLSSLVEKSVLTAIHGATTRFRMLQPIRQRGLAELRTTFDTDAQLRRHAEFYLSLVEQAHAGWFSSAQLAWIDRVGTEIGNIAAALEYCTQDSDVAAQGLRGCGQLLEFVHIHGLFGQGRRWCERLLAVQPSEPESRALALRANCWWSTMQGDLGGARAMAEEGLLLAQAVDGEAEILLTQAAGLVALYADEYDECRNLLELAIRGFKDSGNLAELAHSWMLLAIVNAVGGAPEEAMKCYREGLAITQPAGEGWVQAWTMWAAALASWKLGDSMGAQNLLRKALDQEHRMTESMGIGSVMEAMAWIVAPTSPEQSALLLGAAQNEWDRVEAPVYRLADLEAVHASALAIVHANLGDAFDEVWNRGRSLDRAQAISACFGNERQVSAIARRGAPQLLTARELEVARLIDEGLSNPQIADELVISRRTAEGHVQHIFNKLGFTNRMQIARWYQEFASRGESASSR